jgi:hypothetical protein
LLMASFSAWRLYFLRRLLWQRTVSAHQAAVSVVPREEARALVIAVLGSSREPHGRRVGERLVPLLSSYQMLVLLISGRDLVWSGWVLSQNTADPHRPTHSHTHCAYTAYRVSTHTYTQHEQRTCTAWATHMYVPIAHSAHNTRALTIRDSTATSSLTSDC